MTPTFFFTDLLVRLNLAHTQNFSFLGSVEVVNYTFPGGGRRRVTIENNATQPSCAGVGAELGKKLALSSKAFH